MGKRKVMEPFLRDPLVKVPKAVPRALGDKTGLEENRNRKKDKWGRRK